MTLQVGDVFSSIEAAKDAVNSFILDAASLI